MDFKTSQFSLTSRVQQLCLTCNDELTKYPVINAVISRIASILLSPAAVVDFGVHVIALPFSVVYAVGKSIYQKQADFMLPWQHLQRIREAAFPILFGSVFGVIHPYLGIYATEPKTKHIAGGYLLSNSSKEVDVVISPIAAYRETISNMRGVPKDFCFPKEYERLTKGVMEWEKSLEKIQSFEMFDFKITRVLMGKIYDKINNSSMPTILKEIISRISLIVYPIFAILDITSAVTVSTIFLVTGVVQLMGAKSPAYLETTNSPILHIYHIAKVMISAVGLIAGFCTSPVSPKRGLDLCYPSSKTLGIVPLLLRMQFMKLKKQINSLSDNGRLLLPIVIQNSVGKTSTEQDVIPGNNSHMTYLLIEKNNGKFSAELIERGSHHGAKYQLSNEEVFEIAKKSLSLRFSSTNKNLEDFLRTTFSEKKGLVDLGEQASLSNCVITNLFATFDVINNRNGDDERMHQLKLKAFKLKAMMKYDYFKYDFFPYAPMDAVIEEIDNLVDMHI